MFTVIIWKKSAEKLKTNANQIAMFKTECEVKFGNLKKIQILIL